MKKLLFITLVFCSCTFTKKQKAEKLIKDYLQSTLNDPHSYESVSFTPLYKLKDTIMEYKGKPDTVKYLGYNEIGHTYRAKNGFGAIITKTDWFQVDSAFTKVECCFREIQNKTLITSN